MKLRLITGLLLCGGAGSAFAQGAPWYGFVMLAIGSWLIFGAKMSALGHPEEDARKGILYVHPLRQGYLLEDTKKGTWQFTFVDARDRQTTWPDKFSSAASAEAGMKAFLESRKVRFATIQDSDGEHHRKDKTRPRLRSVDGVGSSLDGSRSRSK
jgi:hypothetical protein